MKKATALILAFVFLLPLASCAKNKPVIPSETDVPNMTSEHGEPTETKKPDTSEEIAPPEPLPTDIDFSYTYDPNTDCFASGTSSWINLAETEYAYYWKNNNGGYIFYSDKVSGEFGALCGKPDCIHEKDKTNAECNALVGYDPLSWIYIYDGMLYFLIPAKAPDGRVLSTLCREELDGSNRKQLFSIDTYEHAFQSFYIHRGKAFFTAATDFVEGGLPKKRLEFFCSDLDGKGFHSVFEETLDGELGFTFSAGFFGDYAFFFVSSYEVGFAMDSNSDTTLYAYDLKNDKVYLVASQEDCEISIYSVYVDTNGAIYVAPSGFNRNAQASIYKLVDGEFIKQYEFEGENYFGPMGFTRIWDGLAFVLTADWDIEGADTIWIKDMDGNTVYNGPLTRHFIEGRKNVVVGVKNLMIHGNAIFIAYENWLEDDPDYTILVRYEITENGLVETTLAEY